MARVVVYDANVLFPAGLRDILLQLALDDLVLAYFSPRILSEVTRSLSDSYPEVDQDSWERLKRNMINVRPGICVDCDERLAADHRLPDARDQHVLALAIQTGAGAIVTENIADFPARVLRPLGIRAVQADEFLLEVTRLDHLLVLKALGAVAARLVNPPLSERQILRRAGLERTLQALLGDLPG